MSELFAATRDRAPSVAELCDFVFGLNGGPVNKSQRISALRGGNRFDHPGAGQHRYNGERASLHRERLSRTVAWWHGVRFASQRDGLAATILEFWWELQHGQRRPDRHSWMPLWDYRTAGSTGEMLRSIWAAAPRRWRSGRAAG
ncbi:MAG: hypothetical protein WA709_05740 [Stellaceae bacterium]